MDLRGAHLLFTLAILGLTIRGQENNAMPCTDTEDDGNGSSTVCLMGYYSIGCKSKCPNPSYGCGCKLECNCTETQICHFADGCIQNATAVTTDTLTTIKTIVKSTETAVISDIPDSSSIKWEYIAIGAGAFVAIMLLGLSLQAVYKRRRERNATTSQERVIPVPPNSNIELDLQNNVYEEIKELENDYSTYRGNSGVYNELSLNKCVLQDANMICGPYSTMASIREMRTQEMGASMAASDETGIRICDTDKHQSDGDDIVMEIKCHVDEKNGAQILENCHSDNA